MTAIYCITRYFTFFGTELRTFFEHIMCRVFRIPVEDSRAFKNSELCGHIEHELTENTKQSFFLCFVPFALNFVLGNLNLLAGSYFLFYSGSFSLEAVITFWLGLSLVSNCAPSFEDALSLKDHIYGGKGKFKKIVLAPFFGIMYAFSFLERYSVTFILAVVYSVFFPYFTAGLIF